jgi:hypothetical protein
MMNGKISFGEKLGITGSFRHAIPGDNMCTILKKNEYLVSGRVSYYLFSL